MTMIPAHLVTVRQRMNDACMRYGRDPGSVVLLAVSKTHGPDVVEAAYRAGQTAFGENYVQEAVEKITTLRHLPLQWHCIGPIQSNKTRLVAEHFDWIHTVDRLKIAQRLSEQRPASMAPLQVCVQVNVDGGSTKSGVTPSDALALAHAVCQLPNLKLRGLMCIPEPAPDFEAACAVFTRARDIFSSLNAQDFALDTLSMGMSADLEAAIASGSTMVRVGSAIFGERHYPAAAAAGQT
jgi:pyridoxal phosphate enzyme (YggS family)